MAESIGRKAPFRVNSNARKPLHNGLSYGMLYRGQSEKIPTVPQPVYSSMFQRILIHRWQISNYISSLRNYGLRPDYPAAHVLSMIPSSPESKGGNTVKVSRFGRPASSGTMAPPRRFRKALPVSKIPYTPPEY